MKGVLIALFIIFAATLILLIILTAVSRLYFKRSLMATLAEWFLRLTEKRLTEEEVLSGIDKLPLKNDVSLTVPEKYAKKMSITKTVIDGMQVFCFYGSNNPTASIIYLHGAGYVRPPRKQHWRFAFNLAKKTGDMVKFAVYLKAPNHSYDKNYEILTKLYLDTRENFDKVILMGDSSGGGLALGLSEFFSEQGFLQPDELILLSPWLDISLTNPEIEKYRSVDPIVFVDNDIIWGKCWARDTDLKYYKLSPIYGRLNGLKSVSIFIGTREVLYPDAILLRDLLIKNGVKVKTYIGKGLNHVYPIYPIPEAKKALNQIAEIIK